MVDIADLDEKEAVPEDFQEVAEILPEFVRDRVAAAKNDLKALKGINESQRSRIEACVYNLYLAKGWKDWHPVNEWGIDNSGFFHLYSMRTFMGARLHAVDPITRGLPKSNHSLADRSRYSQNGGKGRGELSINFLGYPDLSDVHLTIACDYLFPANGFLRAYKPMSPGKYGQKGISAYSFPILNGDDGNARYGWTPGFDPTPETDVDLLEGLIIEENMKIK